jgi:peptidoglycan/LPS O-acetylase OafA/YrhL
MKQLGHKLSIDGLRGIAIGMVVLFHVFGRWPNLTPWLSEYASLWPVKYGHLGVELFFLISGYLIAQSLESSKSFVHFAFKRWLRLFPLMLLATCLILATSRFLIERPPGIPDWSDALPGLLFLHPYFFEKFFGLIVQPLEWAYWSLFVEVVFYAIFGLMYFARKNLAVNGLCVIFLLAVTYKFGLVNSGLSYSIVVLKLIDACFIHFGWFYLGSAMYQRNTSGNYSFWFFTIILIICIYIKMGTDLIGSFVNSPVKWTI